MVALNEGEMPIFFERDIGESPADKRKEPVLDESAAQRSNDALYYASLELINNEGASESEAAGAHILLSLDNAITELATNANFAEITPEGAAAAAVASVFKEAANAYPYYDLLEAAIGRGWEDKLFDIEEGKLHYMAQYSKRRQGNVPPPNDEAARNLGFYRETIMRAALRKAELNYDPKGPTDEELALLGWKERLETLYAEKYADGPGNAN